MKHITFFPDYPVTLHKMEELKRYRKKVLHAQVTEASMIRMLNGPSSIIRTVEGQHLNKRFIVGARDYVDPTENKSRLAQYERRNQVNLYISIDLSTLDVVSGIIAVRKFTKDIEVCLERALFPSESSYFTGIMTDWNTTEKLDNLIDPEIYKVLDTENLSHSFLAVNRNMIKGYRLIRDMGQENLEGVIQPKTAS